MVKPLSFKDFMNVEYRPGEDDLVNYRAYKVKRLDCDVDYTEDDRISLDELLSISGRRKKARDARRRKTQLKRARKIARRKLARDPVLKKRSRRAARKEMEKKLLKGKKKADMSDAIKASIERRLDNNAFKKRIDMRQKRLMPTKRKQEIARKKK
tara:strand:- start:7 stop:471 length:465 start_codon:yes stop_codon:yes gene_type:complete